MLCGWKAFTDLAHRDKDVSWQQCSIMSQVRQREVRQEINTEKQLKSFGEKNLMEVEFIIKRQQKEKKDGRARKANLMHQTKGG